MVRGPASARETSSGWAGGRAHARPRDSVWPLSPDSSVLMWRFLDQAARVFESCFLDLTFCAGDGGG